MLFSPLQSYKKVCNIESKALYLHHKRCTLEEKKYSFCSSLGLLKLFGFAKYYYCICNQRKHLFTQKHRMI